MEGGPTVLVDLYLVKKPPGYYTMDVNTLFRFMIIHNRVDQEDLNPVSFFPFFLGRDRRDLDNFQRLAGKTFFTPLELLLG